MFGKAGRFASENVVAKLLKTKCFAISLYGLEACPLTKTQVNSLSYAISSSFRKIFNVTSNEIVFTCVGPCLIVPTLKILCVVQKQNSCTNIALLIILFVLCVDIGLTSNLHH